MTRVSCFYAMVKKNVYLKHGFFGNKFPRKTRKIKKSVLEDFVCCNVPVSDQNTGFTSTTIYFSSKNYTLFSESLNRNVAHSLGRNDCLALL